jgi:predicted hotdog family 3-hydroxylacyl-ACP dehydratase
MKVGREEIARLVPHAGAMCLLDEVLEWDDARIVCRTRSHLDAANPLRSDGALPALAGIEYAGQAMAAHGALCESGARGRAGYLVSVRDVVLAVARLDDLDADLTVTAARLSPAGPQLLYDFHLQAGGRKLVAGRALVVLRERQ